MIHPPTGDRTWIDEAADRFEFDWIRSGSALMEMDLMTPLSSMPLIDEVAIHDRFDITDGHLAAPVSRERSVLYQRISHRRPARCLDLPPPGSTAGAATGSPTEFAECPQPVDVPGGKSLVVRESH